MNFIQSIFDSYQKNISRFCGDIPYEIQSFCIGSGSSFNIYLNLSFKRADKIYRSMIERLSLGKIVESKRVGGFLFEKYHCLESSTGYTCCFLFPISSVEYFNPNEVLDEYIDTLQKREKFKKDFIKYLEKNNETR